MKTEARATLLRFGLFEVDLEADELRKKGYRVKLQDQQLNLLRVLLETPGEIVSRETLRERLWKPDTFVEFDHSLNTAMMRLREVLGDTPDNPIFIETVPRKGYRFIAPLHDSPLEPVRAPENSLNSDQAADELATASLSLLRRPTDEAKLQPVSESARQVESLDGTAPASNRPALGTLLGRYYSQIVLSLLFLLAAASAIMTFFPVRHQQSSLADRSPAQAISLVVLPMENLSEDKSQDYFADGMTDELIASLARISSLRVISRTTAMEYKGTHKSLEKIAHELGADAVVEGTVLRSGNRVRITAELVQVSTDRHLWADTYESQVGDILALQNQVASAIVGQVRITLTPQDKQRLATRRPINAAAYEDYLKGRYYWGKRSEESLLKAVQYFQSASEKDPQYALAYAGLADCYAILGAAIVGTVPAREVAQKAERAATRAVELDATLAETQTALATVQFNYDWNWAAAESGFRRAIELNPNYATAHQRYSLYLAAMGRREESLAEINLARALDPLSLSMNFSLGWRLYMAGQFEPAAVQLSNTIEMDPSFVLPRIVLGQCLEQKKEYSLAIAQLQKAAALSHGSPPVIASLGHAYALAGKHSEALAMIRKLQLQSANEYVSPFYVAVVYAGLDDRAQTMKWLNKAFDDRSNNLIFLRTDPQFKNLMADPSFQDLLHRVGF